MSAKCRQLYQLSLQSTEAFLAAANQMLSAVPEEQRTGMAYTISKNFVVWFTSRMAVRYGKKGIRIVSISPGTFKTPMGEVEGEQHTKSRQRFFTFRRLLCCTPNYTTSVFPGLFVPTLFSFPIIRRIVRMRSSI